MTPSTDQKKRKRLNLAEKADIIRRLKLGSSVADVARDYGCARRTVQKASAESGRVLLALEEQSFNTGYKAIKAPRFPEIDRLLYEFVQGARAAKLPISMSTLQHRALHIRDELMTKNRNEDTVAFLQTFSASSNWVTAFVQRHALRSVRLHGEGGSVSVQNVSMGISTLREDLLQYNETFVFNMDEKGLFTSSSRRRPTSCRRKIASCCVVQKI